MQCNLQRTSRELDSSWRMQVVRQSTAKRDVWKRYTRLPLRTITTSAVFSHMLMGLMMVNLLIGMSPVSISAGSSNTHCPQQSVPSSVHEFK